MSNLAPDWLRIGTDIVGGGAFNAAFSLTGSAVPEPSTWAMMLLGFAGLGFAGYRRAKSIIASSSPDRRTQGFFKDHVVGDEADGPAGRPKPGAFTFVPGRKELGRVEISRGERREERDHGAGHCKSEDGRPPRGKVSAGRGQGRQDASSYAQSFPHRRRRRGGRQPNSASGAGRGSRGERTKQAALAFQTAAHLATDAIVGPLTWKKLIEQDF